MPEYTDHGHVVNKRPASNPQQAAYDLLRGNLQTALRREWKTICAASPAVADAAQALDIYVETHSALSFRIFRPEDTEARHESGDSLFLR